MNGGQVLILLSKDNEGLFNRTVVFPASPGSYAPRAHGLRTSSRDE
jgi:hypothetical protein